MFYRMLIGKEICNLAISISMKYLCLTGEHNALLFGTTQVVTYTLMTQLKIGGHTSIPLMENTMTTRFEHVRGIYTPRIEVEFSKKLSDPLDVAYEAAKIWLLTQFDWHKYSLYSFIFTSRSKGQLSRIQKYRGAFKSPKVVDLLRKGAIPYQEKICEDESMQGIIVGVLEFPSSIFNLLKRNDFLSGLLFITHGKISTEVYETLSDTFCQMALNGDAPETDEARTIEIFLGYGLMPIRVWEKLDHTGIDLEIYGGIDVVVPFKRPTDKS
jgi:hypothetical protein